MDPIDRQDAIDALENLSQTFTPGGYAAMYTTDVFEAIEGIPSQPIIHCGECRYAEVADPSDTQDGYTCQFHRGSIWFSGSYCSWAERREDETE